jgi:hypothetical protein
MARHLGLAHPGGAVGRTEADFLGAERAQISRRDEEEVMESGTHMPGPAAGVSPPKP